jgi:hypothetical protein
MLWTGPPADEFSEAERPLIGQPDEPERFRERHDAVRLARAQSPRPGSPGRASRLESRLRETEKEAGMAVAMLQMADMFTKEIYDQVSEKMFGHTDMRPEEAPEGLILHSAGQGDRGWYVYDIWESREAFERFSDEKLMPAIKEVMGDVQPPPEAAPQFYDVQVVVIPR